MTLHLTCLITTFDLGCIGVVYCRRLLEVILFSGLFGHESLGTTLSSGSSASVGIIHGCPDQLIDIQQKQPFGS